MVQENIQISKNRRYEKYKILLTFFDETRTLHVEFKFISENGKESKNTVMLKTRWCLKNTLERMPCLWIWQWWFGCPFDSLKCLFLLYVKYPMAIYRTFNIYQKINNSYVLVPIQVRLPCYTWGSIEKWFRCIPYKILVHLWTLDVTRI